MNKIIKIENLGKKYIIEHKQQERYVALRDVITNSTKEIVRKITHSSKSKRITIPRREEFWALRNVSFDIEQGDRVGIIGRNGAGKTTLLKLLSRITEPSEGRIKIKGRVASLLEVGTGFHPELTGRENIYLNGAILGMARKEIKKKFNEIVDFAEVERFIDTPVKRYSSGMYVRLAFAVAAHLEPEILLVDEVLAVGDFGFQKKCLGKMKEVGKEGRTVVFVSHNMAAIESLCEKGIVLINGNIAKLGKTKKVIDFYLGIDTEEEIKDLSTVKKRGGRGEVRLVKIEIKDSCNSNCVSFPIGSKLSFCINYKAKKEVNNPRVIIGVYDFMNTQVTRFDTNVAGGLDSKLPKKGSIICSTEKVNLAPGSYNVNIAFFSNNVIDDHIIKATKFEIIDSDYFKTGRNFDKQSIKVLLKHNWELRS